MSPARRLVLVLSALTAVLVLTAAVALFLGSARLAPGAVMSALAGRAGPQSVEHVVTLSIRLPRIAAAVLAGGALAVAGVAFQALTRNPLAEPSVLGISAGAAFGVVIGQSFGLGLSLREAVGLTAFTESDDQPITIGEAEAPPLEEPPPSEEPVAAGKRGKGSG